MVGVLTLCRSFTDISQSYDHTVIYVDQPIGTGFSFGTDPVNSTITAAPAVWTAFQILFESKLFHKYASRKFVVLHHRVKDV